MNATVVVAAISEDLVSTRLRQLTRCLLASGERGNSGFLGGKDGYGIDFSNDVFVMRQHDENPPDCTCGACDLGGDGRCARDCAFNLPNFRCGDFEVRWHKYIGRSMDVHDADLDETAVVAMFDRCEGSLRP